MPEEALTPFNVSSVCDAYRYRSGIVIDVTK